MALGEAEVGEGLDAAVDLVGELPGDAVLGHADVESLAQRLDALETALAAHGAAQQVGVVARAATDRHRHLHELLLKDGDAEGALKWLNELGVVVSDGLMAELAAHKGVHGAALNGTGTYERDLHDEVVELSRLQTRQQAHLGAALDLEHADRVGAAQHVVGRLLFFR